MSHGYDTIVIGFGGMGSAATASLARRGRRVLAIEQFDLLHELGSSAGGIRIFRFAYFLDPRYVPLMRRAYDRWAALERDADERLLFTTGGLDIGNAKSEVFNGAKVACEQHDLPHEILTANELMRRHPAWSVPPDYNAVFQPDAGYLPADRAIAAHARVALRYGATIHAREQVIHFEERSGKVVITTDRATYEAEQLVVTAGPWTGTFLPSFAATMVPERQVVGWYQPDEPALFHPERFPIFIVEDATGHYYGFPEHDRPGFKIGRHRHQNETTTPTTIRRTTDEADDAVLRRALSHFLPAADKPALTLKTCMYTNSPDSHFVVDRLPGHEAVVVAAGFSGHGYKFCSAIGDMLADLALGQPSSPDFDLFRIDRPALQT
jgi:sarcosine oxidase